MYDHTAIITTYLNAWKDGTLTDEGIAIYVKKLERYPVQLVEAAMAKLLETARFFPSLAEIIDTINGLNASLSDAQDKSIDEAWNEVTTQIHSAFIYKKPVFSSRAIEEAARNMGWESMCMMSAEQVPTVRAQFERFYKAALARLKDKAINARIMPRLQQMIKNTEALEQVGSQKL